MTRVDTGSGSQDPEPHLKGGSVKAAPCVGPVFQSYSVLYVSPPCLASCQQCTACEQKRCPAPCVLLTSVV